MCASLGRYPITQCRLRFRRPLFVIWGVTFGTANDSRTRSGCATYASTSCLDCRRSSSSIRPTCGNFASSLTMALFDQMDLCSDRWCVVFTASSTWRGSRCRPVYCLDSGVYAYPLPCRLFDSFLPHPPLAPAATLSSSSLYSLYMWYWTRCITLSLIGLPPYTATF
ncbi:hypothetical protein FA15DRAFT_218083 [Coprinopsis marcescibilis]|uniref:Uncharacterized protein n=1 Tax=Coprinopsis marcescibilis TaxID=230819 RepID=A0A5C3L3J5_COPMA|nr:hypothetical protein FA15DRAFT_218083 [Coprinopsis marcescibilis]